MLTRYLVRDVYDGLKFQVPPISPNQNASDGDAGEGDGLHRKVDMALANEALDVVNQTLRRMPMQLQLLAGEVRVHFEDYASEEVVEQGFEPDILGLFVGEAVGQEAHSDNPFPAQIILYIGSLWDFCEGDLPTFREEVRLTYLHELGHYFGWDEDQVAQHGLE